MRRFRMIALALIAVVLHQGSVSAVTIDFETLRHGEFVTNQFQTEHGLLISAVNRTGPDAALIFNSNARNTADPDLQSPFVRGNLAPTAGLGHMLIIAENVIDRNNDGLVDSPDDEGARPAGSLLFQFDQDINSFGFDLVDVEGPEEFGQDSGFVATFFSGATELARVGFGSFVDPGSNFFDASVVFGNNSANRIDPITAEALQIDPFNRVEVNFGGSAAIDNINFGRPAPLPPIFQPPVVQPVGSAAIPEPGTWIMLIICVVMIFGWRYRRVATH